MIKNITELEQLLETKRNEKKNYLKVYINCIKRLRIITIIEIKNENRNMKLNTK